MKEPLDYMRIRRDIPNNAFGMVRNNGTRPHQGWDIWAPVGTNCIAIADGKVEFVVTSGAYGTQICISFKDTFGITTSGTLYALYAHLSQTFVAKGNSVYEGQTIGQTGKSGNASGFTSIEDEHLHFEIRTQLSPGKGLSGRIDPARLFGYDLLTCSEEEEMPVCTFESDFGFCMP